MDVSEIINNFVSFGDNQTLTVIALALVLLLFLYRKPKLFFASLVLGLFLAGLFYVISSTARFGSEHTKRLLESPEKHSNHVP